MTKDSIFTTDKSAFDLMSSSLNLDVTIKQRGWSYYEKIVNLQIKPIPNKECITPVTNIWICCALFLSSSSSSNLVLEDSKMKPTSSSKRTRKKSLKARGTSNSDNNGATSTSEYGNFNNNVESTIANYTGIDLLQLLKATGVKVTNFFEHILLVLEKFKLNHIEDVHGDSMHEKIQILKSNFVVTSLMFKKYKVLWSTCETWATDHEPTSKLQATPIRATTSRLRDLFTTGWNLYLLSKSSFYERNVDIATSYNLLIAIVHFIVTNSILWSPSTANLPKQEADAVIGLLKAGNGTTHMAETADPHLIALCTVTKMPLHDLNVLVNGKINIFSKELIINDFLRGNPSFNDCNSFFGSKNLNFNKNSFSCEYQSRFLTSIFELDERLFLKTELHIHLATPHLKLFKGERKLGPGNLEKKSSSFRALNFSDDRKSEKHQLKKNAAFRAATLSPFKKRKESKLVKPTFASDVISQLIKSPYRWKAADDTIKRATSKKFPSLSFSEKSHDHSSDMHHSNNATPVSAAVEASIWLQNAVQGVQEIPSLDTYTSLLKYMHASEELLSRERSTNTDWSNSTSSGMMEVEGEDSPPIVAKDDTKSTTLSHCIEIRLLNILNGYSSIPKALYKDIIALYYSTLELLLTSESERVGEKDFSDILTDEAFHRSLIACCLETVFFTRNMVTMAFPKVLTIADCSAYDLWKMLDNFTQSHITMPLYLSSHFDYLEELLLDSECWKSHSPIYKIIEDEPENAYLKKFMNKVMELALSRVSRINNLLQLKDDIKNQIIVGVKYGLDKAGTLLYNRHLDHIILCTIYAICKVNGNKLSFQDILDKFYNKMTKSSTSSVNRLALLRNVDITVPTKKGELKINSNPVLTAPDPAKKCEDKSKACIVTLYNNVYVPIMKTLISKLKAGEIGMELDLFKYAKTSEGIGGMRLADSSMTTSTDAEEYKAPDIPRTNSATTTTTTTSSRKGSHRPPLHQGGPPRKPLGMKSSPPGFLSPHRIPNTRIFMSPASKLRRSFRELTPQTGSLFCFGESPRSDLSKFNKNIKRTYTSAFDGKSDADMGDDNNPMFVQNSIKRMRNHMLNSRYNSSCV